MTTQEMMMILLPSLAGGLGSVVQNKQAGQANQQSQQNLATQQLLSQMGNKAQILQGLQQNRQQMAQSGLNASPLGQEQQYVQRARMMQALMPALAGFQGARPTDPGIASSYRPASNVLQSVAGNKGFQDTFSDQMTSQSLADRRKALALVNPQMDFSSLTGFGMDGSYDQGVNDVKMDALARLKGFEAEQRDLADQQVQQAQLAQSQANQASQQKKGGGIGGFLGGVLKVASPFAALIPGVGPMAAMGLGAAGSALGSKLQGGSMKDVILGGLVGGGGALGAEALQRGGNPFAKAGPQLNNQMTSASLPQLGIGPTNPQMQLQSSMNPSMTPFPQALNQQGPNLPMFNKADPRGGPQQGPPQQLPFAISHGSQAPSQPSYSGPDQTLMKATGIGAQPQPDFITQLLRNISGQSAAQAVGDLTGSPLSQQPLVQQMQNPMVGMMMGGVAGQIPRAASALGQMSPQMSRVIGGMNQDQAVGQMSRAAAAGQAQRAAQFGQQYNQAMRVPSVNTQLGARNVLNTLGANNGMTTAERAALNASPEAQQLFQSLSSRGFNTGQNAQNILNTLGANNGMTAAEKAQFLASPQAQAILKALQSVR